MKSFSRQGPQGERWVARFSWLPYNLAQVGGGGVIACLPLLISAGGYALDLVDP